MDFVAIDFETANEKRSSPCSLGITVIKNSQIVEERYWLIRPMENRFAPINIMIHGIRPGDVEQEPEFDVLWPQIKPYLEHQLVVAHNAAFDFSVLRNTLDLYGLDYPDLDYCCTMNMSRHYYSFLDNAKLNTVNDFLGFEFSHHHASADATACANILLSIAGELECEDITEIASKTGVKVGKLYSGGYTAAGTTKTNIVVTNARDIFQLSPGQMSTKLRKAAELKEKGFPIEFLNESRFLELLYSESSL